MGELGLALQGFNVVMRQQAGPKITAIARWHCRATEAESAPGQDCSAWHQRGTLTPGPHPWRAHPFCKRATIHQSMWMVGVTATHLHVQIALAPQRTGEPPPCFQTCSMWRKAPALRCSNLQRGRTAGAASSWCHAKAARHARAAASQPAHLASTGPAPARRLKGVSEGRKVSLWVTPQAV